MHLLSSSLSAAVEAVEAVEAEIIASNPAVRLRLAGRQASVEHFLSREEVDAACGHLKDDDLSMVLLLVGTGVRWDEDAGLHWEHFDVDRGVLEVSGAWSEKDRTMKPYRRVASADTYPSPTGCPSALGPCGHTHPACPSGLVITTATGATAGKNRGV